MSRFVSYKHAAFDFTRLIGLLIGLQDDMDYCDVFISCLDSHSDGTHSLQPLHSQNLWYFDCTISIASGHFLINTSFSLNSRCFLLQFECFSCFGTRLSTPNRRLFEIPTEKMSSKSTPGCFWAEIAQRPPFGAAEATEVLAWHSERQLWLRAPVIASESSRMFSSRGKAGRPKSLLSEPCKDRATPEAAALS